MKKFTFTAKEKAILTGLPIEVLVLFGSQARGTAGKLSDYDIGVAPPTFLNAKERKAVYDTLYDLLSAKIQRLVNIDIVFLSEASMELQFSAANLGIPLYERSPYAFAKFRERVMNIYADLAPIRKMFQQAILSRIS